MKVIRSVLPTFLLSLWAVGLYAQPVQQIREVFLTVGDLEQAITFYTGVLRFEHIETQVHTGAYVRELFSIADTSMTVSVATLRLGDESVGLMEFRGNTPAGRPVPHDSRSNDLWFQHQAIVVRSMPEAYRHLRDHKVAHISTGPQLLPDYLPGASGISAFYFMDPDGHPLELIHFPPDKGNPKWQQHSAALFMGIDHTAIDVAHSRNSLSFYRDIPGLNLSGSSENYGTEQEHLNQVFGARLMIYNLRAGTGSGLELLDYLAPPGGRPYPTDTRPPDLWYAHTAMEVEDAEQAYNAVLAAGYPIRSSGLVDLEKKWCGAERGFIVQDPDGHALLIFD